MGKMRSAWEQTCLLVIFCGFLVSIPMATASADASNPELNDSFPNQIKRDGGERGNVCTSTICASQSAIIVSNIDPSADPCQDFYRHACGKWNRTNPFSHVFSMWTEFHHLQLENYLVIEKTLEQPAESLKSEAEKNAQRYYQSCLQMTKKAKQNVGPGVKVLQNPLNLVGGWPVVDEISNDLSFNPNQQWNFQEAFQTATNIMYTDGGFFDWGIDIENINKSDTRRYIIKINPGGLTLSNPKYYLNETDSGIAMLTSTFNNLVKEAMDSFSLNWDKTITEQVQLFNLIKDIIEVETQIARITPLVESKEEPQHLTIADLNNLAPFIDWLQFFQTAFSQVNITMTPSRHVLVWYPTFFRDLSDLVNDLLSTASGQMKLRNYMLWHIILDYFEIVRKSWEVKAREEYIFDSCVTDTINAMGFAVGAMFIRKKFDVEANKHLAEAMMESIKEAFKENYLENLFWLDDDTRFAVKDKVDAMSSLIGYPKFILNPTELEEYYEDLTFESDEYFLNNVRLIQFLFKKEMKVIDQLHDKNKWDSSAPVSVVAAYYPQFNRIVLSSGILQQPFFDVAFPNALNFGSVGVIIGHELTHGFDNSGRLFDRNGNLRQWWNSASIQRFERRAECFRKQYSNFAIDGHPVDGKLTLGENIADNGGLKVALKAFKNWVNVHEDEFVSLPRLNITHEQLFFLSYAQSFCSTSGKAETFDALKNDVHSPEHYRVVGSLANMHEFARAFNCLPGSPMNPVEKCEIW